MSVPSLTLDYPVSCNKLSLSFRFLLGLYVIVPLSILVLWLDQAYFNAALRDWLPSSPGHFLLFQLFFGTPHILASNLLLVSNRDYLKTFQKKMIGMTLFIAVFFGL
ncbi:MAG: hypothetical protein RL563_1194, partial [Pseudomonadota bacterium]